MLKTFTQGQDGPILIGLGLSRANIERMMSGQPVRVLLKELGVPGDIRIGIFFGETEADMEAELRQHDLVTDETLIHKDVNLS
jgi:hypothetical protein